MRAEPAAFDCARNLFLFPPCFIPPYLPASVLKLYGSPEAGGATQTALIALLEKHVSFEFSIQPFKPFPAIESHSSSACRSRFLNPQGDDRFIRYESRAICRYLEHNYPDQGTGLEPARSLYEQALTVEAFNFHPHAHWVRRGLNSDERFIREALKRLSEILDVCNQVLAKTRYLAGDEFTLADLFHIAFGGTLIRAGHDIMTCRCSQTLFGSWWNDIQSRSSVRRFPEAGLFTSVASYRL
ncbi:unnamed protein product [Mycena citricolor]|uniref:glutathione transferase n=1 Tax=Mycena citricolor TaxID=2018698 RepID=A0AAD2JXZ5_9AGAR|nr:unnamed protein product [Mycena citricolor]